MRCMKPESILRLETVFVWDLFQSEYLIRCFRCDYCYRAFLTSIVKKVSKILRYVDHNFRIEWFSIAWHTMGFSRLEIETEQTKMHIYYIFEDSSQRSHEFYCLCLGFMQLYLLNDKYFSASFIVALQVWSFYLF